jgi:hypothetical protein
VCPVNDTAPDGSSPDGQDPALPEPPVALPLGEVAP